MPNRSYKVIFKSMDIEHTYDSKAEALEQVNYLIIKASTKRKIEVQTFEMLKGRIEIWIDGDLEFVIYPTYE